MAKVSTEDRLDAQQAIIDRLYEAGPGVSVLLGKARSGSSYHAAIQELLGMRLIVETGQNSYCLVRPLKMEGEP